LISWFGHESISSASDFKKVDESVGGQPPAMSESTTRSTSPPDLSTAEVLRLKRTLAVTQKELNEAQCGRPKRIP
jgi:hypothetical protein